MLGLGTQADMSTVRAAYRRLIREHHPDVSGESPDRTARLTEAYAVLRRTAELDGSDTVATAPASPPAPPAAPEPSPYERAVEAELASGDTILLRAPVSEAFAALFEAAGRIGHVAYFDRQLGILETIVRFEGGPSCSFLVTLQGRAHGTEAFCTLESIEAAPTPPMAVVMDALVGELAADR